EGEDLNKTYEKIEKEKIEYFKKMIAMNAQDTIKEPTPMAIKNKLFNELLIFFIKTAVITFMIFILIIASQPVVDSSLNSGLNVIFHKGKSAVTQFTAKLSSKLSSLPQADKEKMKTELRKLVQEIKPFTDELKILFEDTKTEFEYNKE
ncbi:MAG: hypothetical protein ABH952_08785, partial [Candidatus Omnitrophota bacterium]